MVKLIARRHARDEDYLIFAGNVTVGRIYKLTGPSVEVWWWGIYTFERPRRTPGAWTGTADTFELAKAAFWRAPIVIVP